MRSEYSPNVWVLIKVKSPNKTIYKVLAGWRGGYLDGDSWKINSGICKIHHGKKSKAYTYMGYSGSKYICYEHCYGTSFLTAQILNTYVEQAKTKGVIITLLSQAEAFTLTNKVIKDAADKAAQDNKTV